jgi:hypothetical protein
VLVGAALDQTVVYAGLPPAILKVILPSQTPAHVMSFWVAVTIGPFIELIA